MEVSLTITEPNRENPHHDEPVDLKRGQVYVLHNHLEVVEDLSFLQDRGRVGGPMNRKARQVFDWDYGVPDTKGERLPGRRGHEGGHDIRLRRDDDDHDDRSARGNRRHCSPSAWARNSRCRGGVEDCISSNRWRGRGESPPRRGRPSGGAFQVTTQVWKVKEHKQEKKIKKVSFADPIVSELKAPKSTIPDNSIMLIKVTGNSTPSNAEQGGSITSAIITNTTAVKGIQMEQHTKPGSATIVDSSSIITPKAG